jgi:L-lactate dehydrogenase complex protein LldE
MFFSVPYSNASGGNPLPVGNQPHVTLFIQCLVDAFAPGVAEAMLTVLRRLGLTVSCQEDHTCCGQPAFNSGYHREARRAAENFLRRFGDAETIVCPSGSCVNMVRHHYLELFADAPRRLASARRVAGRTFEFGEFLVDRLGVEDIGATYRGKVTYHDSCHLLRGLRISEQPRKLLRNVGGLELVEMFNSDFCCGFGGAFAVKYADISTAMVAEKVDNIAASGAKTVVGCDLGCLLNIEGMIRRRGLEIKVKHIAEILASGLD